MTANELGEQCQKADQKGELPNLIKRLCKPDLIILDELGYFDFDKVTANVPFQIVSKRYEKGAMIINALGIHDVESGYKVPFVFMSQLMFVLKSG